MEVAPVQKWVSPCLEERQQAHCWEKGSEVVRIMMLRDTPGAAGAYPHPNPHPCQGRASPTFPGSGSQDKPKARDWEAQVWAHSGPAAHVPWSLRVKVAPTPGH